MTIDLLRATPNSRTSRASRWVWVRMVGGVIVLGLVVWRLGTGPFLDGLSTINVWSLMAATAIGVVTTMFSAWRWCLVARGLGVGLPLRLAVAAYYRSQFLNTVLPGGILGDVHRGVSHGRAVNDVGRGLRAVGWERFAGYIVQIALAMLVLIVLPSRVSPSMPVVLIIVVLLAITVLLATTVLLAPRTWTGIVFASIVIVAGHTATFLIAARTAGSTESAATLVPLAMLVLLASAVPTNVAGWGPREGAAAWAFGAAGLGASQGVATAVVYGVMVFVACVPGGVLMSGRWRSWLTGRTRC